MTEGIVTPIASSSSSTARGSGGRTIGYGEFGDPNGRPVLLFHGFGDSRLTRYPDDELTARLGIRLITFDRPGIGLTDPMKELTILDRTDDVIDLANSLGLHDNISLLGWSGGAPYALAAAGCMAGKVKRVAIVSGFGPFERPGFKRLAPREIKRVMTILKVAPWMANVMATESQKGLQGDATAAMEMSRGIGGSADSAVLNMSGVRANVTSGAEEAFRQGPAGVANDMLLLFRFKWGFNPEDVHAPIDLWYGEDDHMTPPDVGRGLASTLPQPRLRTVPGAGHLLYLRNWEEILRTLVAEDAPATVTTFQAIAPVTPLSPVTEALAAASITETTTDAEPERAEPVGEPVTAQGDVLGSTPAWSWMQPAAEAQPSVEAPAERQAEGEPVGYQAEPEPRDVPAFTPRPKATPAGSDQLARLRALGFIVDVPEPEVAETEAAEAEAEAEEIAAAVETPGDAERPQLEVVQGETAAEPEAEVARPELKLVEPEAAPKRPSLAWQPMRVPGLIIGKPRRVAPVEPEAAVVEPEAVVGPETAVVEPEAVVAEPGAAFAEPEAAMVEADAAVVEEEPVAAEEPIAERDAEPAMAEADGAQAEPEVAPVEAEAETEAAVELEPVVEVSHAPASPAIDSAEARRLRAAGFYVTEPAAQEQETDVEPRAAEPVATEDAASRRARMADDELARLRAAGFAPAQAQPGLTPAQVSPEPKPEAVESESVEPEAVAAELVDIEPVAAEPVESEPVAARETVVNEVEAEPTDEAPVAEAEAAVAEVEAEPAVEAGAAADVQAEHAEEAPVAEVETAVAESEPTVEAEAAGAVEAASPPRKRRSPRPKRLLPKAIPESEAGSITAEVDAVAEVEAEPTKGPSVTEAETAVAESEPTVEAETIVAEVEATPTEDAPIAEADASVEESEPVAVEAEPEPALEEEPDTRAEPAPSSVVTELEEEASETVVFAPREGGAGFAAESEPAPAIAASAGSAQVMKASARTQPRAEAEGDLVVETGVGWVETVPMDVATAAAATSSPDAEPDSPPEPMMLGSEEPADQAPVRDETLERLRAAGFLIGEPGRR